MCVWHPVNAATRFSNICCQDSWRKKEGRQKVKKWLLVLCTALVSVVSLSANAASVNPPEMFLFVKSATPGNAGPGPAGGYVVAGPQFPDSGLSQQREFFRNWVIAQTERRESVNQAPPAVVPPAAVPLPAAAWLFGSALLALAGVARRGRG